MKIWKAILLVGGLTLNMGCAGTQTKVLEAQHQMLNDLSVIAAQTDCPSACESLKQYLRAHGVNLP